MLNDWNNIFLLILFYYFLFYSLIYYNHKKISFKSIILNHYYSAWYTFIELPFIRHFLSQGGINRIRKFRNYNIKQFKFEAFIFQI